VLDAYRAAEQDDAAAAVAHDGLFGSGVIAVRTPISASSLEAFGRCGLSWLMQRAWQVEELEEPAADEEIGAAALGSLVHAVLEEVYLDVIARGGDAAAVRAPATRALLDAALRRRFDGECGRRRDALPLCYDAAHERWRSSLAAFLDEDAKRLGEDGARVRAVEHDVALEVLAARDGRSRHVPMHGRFDRLLETADGWRIEDLKTGRRIRPPDKKDVLKGHATQGLSYLLLGEAWARETEHARLGAGAPVTVFFVPLHPDTVGDRDARALVDVTVEAPLVASARETVAVLAELLDAGSFPLLDGWWCRYCAYTVACRRNHAPTGARLAAEAGLADHRDLQRKSSRTNALTIAAIRAADAASAQGAP
jgi:RecB family exonuclease